MGLKDIFTLNHKEPIKMADENGTTTESLQEGETYKQYGFRMAGISQGGVQAFTPCLQSVYLGLKRAQEQDELLQNELQVSLQNKKIEREREKEQEENNLEMAIQQQQSLKEAKEAKEQELAEVRTDEYHRNRSAWITLVISGIILIPFTLYFFIFYSSVAYSAFFKEFSLDALGDSGNFKLSEAIFDSQALTNAYADGFSTLLFILLMPIVFLAFGFILNRWERENGWLKWIKIPAIIVVAFIFDALLSYEICEKIYNFNRELSLEETLPDYSFGLASHDPRFWVIICLGFVSYLIWGFTFGYFVKALDQLDLNEIKREQIGNQIKHLEAQIAESVELQNTYRNNITALRADIQKLVNQINGNVARYDISKIKLELNNFLAGWQQYLSAMGKPNEVKDFITQAFQETTNTLVTI